MKRLLFALVLLFPIVATAQEGRLRSEIGWQYAPGWFEYDGENASFPVGIALSVGLVKGNYSFFMPAYFHFRTYTDPQIENARYAENIREHVVFIGAGMRYSTPFRIYASVALGADISLTEFRDNYDYDQGPTENALAIEGTIGWRFPLTEHLDLNWSATLRERRYTGNASRGFIAGVGMLVTL